MISKNIIEEVKERLIKTYNPREIYLFGSYAWGCPNEESDLDFLIIIEKYVKDQYHTVVDGHRALMDMRIPKDIFVYSVEEFKMKSKDQTDLCYKIKNKGKKIYAKA